MSTVFQNEGGKKDKQEQQIEGYSSKALVSLYIPLILSSVHKPSIPFLIQLCMNHSGKTTGSDNSAYYDHS